MNLDIKSDLQITDEDISWAKSILGKDINFDEEHVDVIKCLESRDVQAFPGSGKTTALVAKLAILAKKWPFTYQGICVLSHTNAAREEIEKRLGLTDTGRKLLSYPHFVGTFQSFFDTYVANSWLRSNGYLINIIDEDITQEYRYKRLSNTAKYYFENKKINNPQKYCCYTSSIGNVNLKVSPGSSTMQSIQKIIVESQRKGYFTFHEMLLFAEEALDNCNEISISLQRRFPIVLIDEAQDNSLLQWRLIDKAFGNNGKTIMQAFGDKNQAIYNSTNEQEQCEIFPREKPLLMSKSNRFDNRIAELANKVALDSVAMNGSDNEFSSRNIKHTIFLFSKSKIDQVLPAYGKLLLETFTDEELKKFSKQGCHVVGHTANGITNIEDANYPKSIFDYCSKVKCNKQLSSKVPKNFKGYFFNGLSKFKSTGEINLFTMEIFSGIKRLLNIVDEHKTIKFSGNSFASSMLELTNEQQHAINIALRDLVQIEELNEDSWKSIKKNIVDIVKNYGVNINGLSSDKNDRFSNFIAWSCADEQNDNGQNKAKLQNTKYVYADAGSQRSVEIQIGSIHSVKGQTHFATLVLETGYFGHNLKALLPYLSQIGKKTKGIRMNYRLKCQYVAMTRARALVCLAMPSDNVDTEQRKALEDVGWTIREII